MNFGDALQALKSGSKVERRGWNGKGMWLVHVRDWGGIGVILPVAPFIAMRTADEKMVPWLASQTDILAEDWCTSTVMYKEAGAAVQAGAGELRQATDGGAKLRAEDIQTQPRLSPGTIIDKPSYVVDVNGKGWLIDPQGRCTIRPAP